MRKEFKVEHYSIEGGVDLLSKDFSLKISVFIHKTPPPRVTRDIPLNIDNSGNVITDVSIGGVEFNAPPTDDDDASIGYVSNNIYIGDEFDDFQYYYHRNDYDRYSNPVITTFVLNYNGSNKKDVEKKFVNFLKNFSGHRRILRMINEFYKALREGEEVLKII